MSDWWEATPDARLSQGDVIGGVPVGVAAHPLTPLNKNKWGALAAEGAWTPNREGVGDLLARARLGHVIVLSHDCELDKDETKGRVIVAPIAAITNLREGDEREMVLAQRRYSKMPLPDLPSLGTSYADLRLSTAVDRRHIVLSSRVAQMSKDGVGRLRLQLIAFFTRYDAISELDSLSKRDV